MILHIVVVIMGLVGLIHILSGHTVEGYTILNFAILLMVKEETGRIDTFFDNIIEHNKQIQMRIIGARTSEDIERIKRGK